MPALARIESVGSPPDLLAEEELFALRVDGAVHRLGSVHVIAEGLGLSRLNVREWLAGKNIPVPDAREAFLKQIEELVSEPA